LTKKTVQQQNIIRELALAPHGSIGYCLLNHFNASMKQEIAALRAAVRKNPFWFLDIPRTSSTTIQAHLGEAFGYPHGKQDLLQNSNSPHAFDYKRTGPVESTLIRSHLPAFLAKVIIGKELWDDITVFTVMREPRSWLYSVYQYTQRYNSLGYSANSFPEFIEQFAALTKLNVLDRVYPGRMLQYEYIKIEGSIQARYILDFSNRNGITTWLNSRLGVVMPPEIKLAQTASEANFCHAWQSLVECGMSRMVESILEKDIEIYRKVANSQDGVLDATEL